AKARSLPPGATRGRSAVLGHALMRIVTTSAPSDRTAERTDDMRRDLPRSRCCGADNVAEGVGFEPTEGCPSHAFQACRFGRSRIPPGVCKRPALARGGQAVCGTPRDPLRAAASRP